LSGITQRGFLTAEGRRWTPMEGWWPHIREDPRDPWLKGTVHSLGCPHAAGWPSPVELRGDGWRSDRLAEGGEKGHSQAGCARSADVPRKEEIDQLVAITSALKARKSIT
jgi:hypothetical protein